MLTDYTIYIEANNQYIGTYGARATTPRHAIMQILKDKEIAEQLAHSTRITVSVDIESDYKD